MAEIHIPDMVDARILDDLVVHPANHLWREGFLRGRVHEHKGAAGVLAVFHNQEVDYLRCQLYRPCLTAVLHQLSPYHRTVFRDCQRPAFNIEVTPFQGDELSLPEACRQRQHEHGEVAQLLGGIQIILHLQRRHDIRFHRC